MPLYLKRYINFLLFFAIINSPLSVLGTFLDIRNVTTYFILIAWLLGDAVFIIINIKHLRFKRVEIIILILLLMSVIVGLFNYYDQFDRRVVTDFTNPLFFMLKAILLRQGFKNSEKFEDYFNVTFFKKIVTYTFVSGIVTVIMYYVLNKIKPMYAGLTPMSHPAFILGLVKGNLVYLLGSLAVIILSGKRALLISSIVILVVYRFKVNGKIISNVFLLSFAILLGVVIFNYGSNTESIAALDKYKWTYETIRDSEIKFSLEDESGILDLITAGRMGEVRGALIEMHPFDFVFGKGVGFTYTYKSFSIEDNIENYSNLHFSPLGLITKYGVPFFLMLLVYFFYCLKGFKNNGVFGVFFGLYLIGVCVDMLFAYVIFVDPLLPIALGYLSYKRK